MKKFVLSCVISVAAAGAAFADAAAVAPAAEPAKTETPAVAPPNAAKEEAPVIAQAPAVATSEHAAPVASQGTVKKDKVNVRSRADKNSEVVTQLSKGETVEVLDRKGDWVKINLPASAKCFVASKFIQDGVVTGDSVYIRCGPSANHKDVGKLSKGDKVEVLETTGDWTKIKPTSHCAGWVAAEFIENTAPAPAAAPVQTSEVVTPPVSLPPPAVSSAAEAKPASLPAAAHPEVLTQYVVKNGYVAAVSDPQAATPYVLKTETIGGRDYIIAFLEAPQTNLSRYESKHVRVLGNQRWARGDRHPVIAVERIERVW